jgi:hypothetical protein
MIFLLCISFSYVCLEDFPLEDDDPYPLEIKWNAFAACVSHQSSFIRPASVVGIFTTPFLDSPDASDRYYSWSINIDNPRLRAH